MLERHLQEHAQRGRKWGGGGGNGRGGAAVVGSADALGQVCLGDACLKVDSITVHLNDSIRLWDSWGGTVLKLSSDQWRLNNVEPELLAVLQKLKTGREFGWTAGPTGAAMILHTKAAAGQRAGAGGGAVVGVGQGAGAGQGARAGGGAAAGVGTLAVGEVQQGGVKGAEHRNGR